MSTPRVVKSWIPEGDDGTLMTLAAMARLARRDASAPLTVHTLAAILRLQPLSSTRPPSDSWGTAQMIREWLAGHFVFLPDPVGVGVFGEPNQDIELVRTPTWMLQQVVETSVARGDCDDAATLAACLSLAAGLPSRFRILGFIPGGPFAHVFTEALTTRGWLDMDVTRPAGPLPTVARNAVYRV